MLLPMQMPLALPPSTLSSRSRHHAMSSRSRHTVPPRSRHTAMSTTTTPTPTPTHHPSRPTVVMVPNDRHVDWRVVTKDDDRKPKKRKVMTQQSEGSILTFTASDSNEVFADHERDARSTSEPRQNQRKARSQSESKPYETVGKIVPDFSDDTSLTDSITSAESDAASARQMRLRLSPELSSIEPPPPLPCLPPIDAGAGTGTVGAESKIKIESDTSHCNVSSPKSVDDVDISKGFTQIPAGTSSSQPNVPSAGLFHSALFSLAANIREAMKKQQPEEVEKIPDAAWRVVTGNSPKAAPKKSRKRRKSVSQPTTRSSSRS